MCFRFKGSLRWYSYEGCWVIWSFGCWKAASLGEKSRMKLLRKPEVPLSALPSLAHAYEKRFCSRDAVASTMDTAM